VICYFSNWANHRSGEASFVPENLEAGLCSHVFYAFASLDTASLEMAPSAARVDIDSGELV
jgi:chitinase